MTGLTPDYAYSEAPPNDLLVKAPRYNNFFSPTIGGRINMVFEHLLNDSVYSKPREPQCGNSFLYPILASYEDAFGLVT